MARVCMVTGKRPAVGNRRSHANNATKHRLLPNLTYHRFWLESENRFIRLRVSTKGMREIDKRGLESVLADMHANREVVEIPRNLRAVTHKAFASRAASPTAKVKVARRDIRPGVKL